MFAAALCEALADLPVIEETGLADPNQRSDFATRVRSYHMARDP